MAAGDTRPADLVDIVHHEMESAFRSHCFYKSVVVASNRKKLILEKEPAGQSTG